ncbi:hypothetical protein FQN54_006717 [Arachnomyces sp. PD_36]|nr:hypothetical protein FQN54_006717 [Arachnomyces sp. PD_36]
MSKMSNKGIQRLLIANRGEIAVRLLQAAREISPTVETFALYTEDDGSHCDVGRPDHAILVPSAASYLDITLLTNLARQHGITAVHPGYGFLSESADFAKSMHEAGILVIGPGPEALARTGDKLQSKKLALECDVPVLPTMSRPTTNIVDIRAFAAKVSYPVMVKAVDGGGGRGIRLARTDGELESAVRGATKESPSQAVFVEKAAGDGFHHIEIQIVGDGTDACHLWERDCSVQRRFQKVVEVAPSPFHRQNLMTKVVDAALRMARAIRYRSLGTVEFLVNSEKSEFYFLEINPRIQVEHTITEAVTGVDLVQTQLRLAMGHTLRDIGLQMSPHQVNGIYSIQLRLCAEDPRKGFSLSMGKVTKFHVPSGHGVRVDTHIDMAGATPLIVGAQFDNLLAKIIVTASSWEATVLKARRVLKDTLVAGLQTNLDLLRGIMGRPDFMTGTVDNLWLEKNLGPTLELGERISKKLGVRNDSSRASTNSVTPEVMPSNILLRKGDSWTISLEPLDSSPEKEAKQHHLRLNRVLQNDFPTSLSADVEYSTSSSTLAYRMQIASTSTSASALLSASHRRGDPNNPNHLVIPLSGKLVELLVAPGDRVAENQVIGFIKQMKMEVEIRSPRAGKAGWVYEMEEQEEDVAEGMLLVEFVEEVRGKL